MPGPGNVSASMRVLPITEELAALSTRAERAAWLQRVPLSVICRDHLDIRAILAESGDQSAVEALDAELSLLDAVRDRHGSPPERMRHAVHYHRATLAIVARGGEGVE